MLRASLRGIWDHKFRTILLGLAVVAGVSFVSASFIFTDTISSAFDGLFASSAEGLDVNVTAVAPEGGFGLQQFRVDESVADDLANQPTDQQTHQPTDRPTSQTTHQPTN